MLKQTPVNCARREGGHWGLWAQTWPQTLERKNRGQSRIFFKLQAEGFELKGDEWVKAETKPEPVKVDTKEPKEPSKSNEIDYGNLAFYNTKSDVHKIEHNDDVEFLRKQMDETGKSQEALLASNWFQGELKSKAETRASAESIPKSTGRGGETQVDDVDAEVAKFNETGVFPANANLETRIKLMNKLTEAEKNKGMFEGPPVNIGSAPKT